MKLRVLHNAIRFRLGRTEVDLLSRGIECREIVYFPGAQRLEYVIKPSPGTAISAWLSDHVIHVEVPGRDLEVWGASNQVGLSAEISVPGETPLQVLIEKDFRCLDPRVSEDQADTFDNPLEAHPSCEAGSQN